LLNLLLLNLLLLLTLNLALLILLLLDLLLWTLRRALLLATIILVSRTGALIFSQCLSADDQAQQAYTCYTPDA
jgi:hypothetical protein